MNPAAKAISESVAKVLNGGTNQQFEVDFDSVPAVVSIQNSATKICPLPCAVVTIASTTGKLIAMNKLYEVAEVEPYIDRLLGTSQVKKAAVRKARKPRAAKVAKTIKVKKARKVRKIKKIRKPNKSGR